MVRREHDILPPGTLFLGKYVLGSPLGRGGNAVVYSAYHLFLGEHVAVKLIPRLGLRSKDAAERARREAKLLYLLRHQNVVAVWDAGISEDEAYVYIVMDLLVGVTLRDIFRTAKRLSPLEVLPIVIQIAEGLTEAHRRGAVHRDLKPENVMVLPGNIVKVLDFGLAKVNRSYGFDSTDDYSLRGTLPYMAPEQILRFPTSPRIDIYSLGIILHEALAGGHYLLRRNPKDLRELGADQCNYDPPLLSEESANVPEGLALVVATMMQKAPENRYPDMKATAKVLRLVFDRLQPTSRHRESVQVRDLLRLAGCPGLGESQQPDAATSSAAGPAGAAPLSAHVREPQKTTTQRLFPTLPREAEHPTHAPGGQPRTREVPPLSRGPSTPTVPGASVPPSPVTPGAQSPRPRHGEPHDVRQASPTNAPSPRARTRSGKPSQATPAPVEVVVPRSVARRSDWVAPPASTSFIHSGYATVVTVIAAVIVAFPVALTIASFRKSASNHSARAAEPSTHPLPPRPTAVALPEPLLHPSVPAPSASAMPSSSAAAPPTRVATRASSRSSTPRAQPSAVVTRTAPLFESMFDDESEPETPTAVPRSKPVPDFTIIRPEGQSSRRTGP